MKKKLTPYLMITPISLILIVFVIGSVIISIVLGFTKYNILTPPVFKGLYNYQRLLEDTKFLKSLKNTISLSLMIVPLQMVLSLLISVFLVSQRDRILGKLTSCLIFVPVLCSNAVVGVVWRELLNGKLPVVQGFFGLFGVDPSLLLGNAKTALGVVAMVSIWKTIGYYVVIFTSGLLSIPVSCHEAAKVDGAGKFHTFWRITLPLLKPTTILALFLSITTSLQCFDLIYNLTGGGPNNSSTTLVVYSYSLCFGSGSAGYAMAISNILFLIILFIALVQSRMLRRENSEVM